MNNKQIPMSDNGTQEAQIETSDGKSKQNGIKQYGTNRRKHLRSVLRVLLYASLFVLDRKNNYRKSSACPLPAAKRKGKKLPAATKRILQRNISTPYDKTPQKNDIIMD